MGRDPLRVLVVDDEEIARKRLVRLIGELDDAEVAGECESAQDLFARLDEMDVDVVLCDIHMPGKSGIDVRRELESGGPPIIFVTAHHEHAVDAFEVGALDYLLKPVDSPRLKKALDRVRVRLAPIARSVPPPADPAADRLPIETHKGVRLVDIRQVTHAELEGALVTVHVGKEQLLSGETLAAIQNRVAPSGVFERVHRRALVNLRHVERLEPVPSGGYVAWLTTGARVEVSRQAARGLRRRLGI